MALAYVFDLETDRLLDASRSNFEDLRVTVCVGAWVALPGGEPGGELALDDYVLHGEDGAADAGALARLGEALDRASELVAYNGRGFDLRVLGSARYFGPERAARWADKLRDPFEVIRARRGSWVKLGELLAANGLGGKTADGVAAVDWWREGQRDKVLEYCRADVAALAALARLEVMRFPIKRWEGEGAARAQAVVGWGALRWGAIVRAARTAGS